MFFDLGCKTAVFREGVPGKELREKVTRKGPFTMLGVGDIRTQANDQWLCVLDTADGGEQFVESLSVNKVTTDFPLIKVNEAVEDVRKDNTNKALKCLSI